MNEKTFEEYLIDRLCSGESGTFHEVDLDVVQRSQLWKYAPQIKTTEQLWENFRDILWRLNQNALDKPLSDAEFNQVKKVITDLKTPFDAGRWLYGLNGKAQVDVTLDDGKKVILKVFNQAEVAAGDTVYQVVNQIRRPPVLAGRQERVFDVTLLINGLPVIQIEEKVEHRGVDEAINQMRQYIEEKQYTGIFSTVQILVAMTPNDAKYMANTTAEQFNKDFSFNWRLPDNTRIRDWQDFTARFLSIPMAHMMATQFMILDGTINRQSIKVMRPYQVYATHRVLKKMRDVDFTGKDNKVGYVWHTTGSGKTITSFKTAWLISKMPNVDKVVFVVDRIQLIKQTEENYRAYDPTVREDTMSYSSIVSDTQSTRHLYQRLRSKGSGIIITSVQKLQHLIKWEKFKLPDKNYVFIVDEAHRSTGGEGFKAIKDAFTGAAWIGYTGTPMFESSTNRKHTEQIFGPLLHAYTIREAIADKNVLGFKVDFQTTISEESMKKDYLPDFYRNEYPNWSKEQIAYKIEHLTPEDIDDTIEPSFYDNNRKHVKLVVEDIFRNWRNRSADGLYNALFTTHVGGNRPSTPMAMMYFSEFQRVNAERRERGESQLKVAITYSLNTSNDDNMTDSNKDLLKAMEIYNEEFGSSFGLQDVDAYTQDVIMRLQKRHRDGRNLDIVIVVDQLLTGFDAPKLNTLYVDRILRGHNLIQAYSRTNRIANLQTKPFGRVVNYRWPTMNAKLMDDALAIYANVNSAETSEEPARILDDGTILAKDYEKLLNETREIVEKLRELSNDFVEWTPSESKREFAFQLLQQYNRNVSQLKQYTPEDGDPNKLVLESVAISNEPQGFDYDNPDQLINALGMTQDEEKNLSTFLTNELKKYISRRKDVPIYQLEFEMTFIKDVTVNYDYLSDLVEKLLNEVHEQKMEDAEKTCKDIDDFANAHPDPREADRIRTTADEIFSGGYTVDTYPARNIDARIIVTEANDSKMIREIQHFLYQWGLIDLVKASALKEKIDVHTYGQYDHFDRRNELSYLMKEAQKTFKTLAADEKIRQFKKIKYRNALREAIYKLADKYALQSR